MKSKKPETEKPLVFCKSCRHFRAPTECMYPPHTTRTITPIKVEVTPGSCLELNKDNACKIYRQA